MSETERLRCDTCEGTVSPDEAIRRKPMGNLDPTRWQTLCCPACGNRLRTVFVSDR